MRTSQSSVGATSGGSSGGGWQKEKCSYCSALGMGLDTHPRARCFVDPSSKMFRPDVRQRRLQAVLDTGGTIPQWILEGGHFTPAPKSNKVNLVIEDETRDLVAAIQSTKRCGLEEAEAAVEKIMCVYCAQQQAE